MLAKTPTLIFVHGAWHGVTVWEKVTFLLAAKHFKCVAVALPSTLGNATTTFAEDIKVVRDAILTETALGFEVLLVLHSYGGAVGQSAIKDLEGVRGMVLITCGFAVTGMSLIDSCTSHLPFLHSHFDVWILPLWISISASVIFHYQFLNGSMPREQC